MEHTFEVRVSQRIADAALRRFVLRSTGWGTLVAAGVCLAYGVYDFWDGAPGLLGLAMLIVVGLLILLYAAVFVTRRKQMADLLRALGDAPVSYRLDGNEIATRSPLGSSAVKWAMIRKLWIDPDLTLVFFTRNAYTTIPTGQVPREALEFLADQVARAGGSIDDRRDGRRGEVRRRASPRDRP